MKNRKISKIKPLSVKGRLLKKQMVAPDKCLLSLQVDLSFPAPQPGQFIMVKPSKYPHLLLRRPFCIYNFTPSLIEILFQIVGRGTEALSLLNLNEEIDILGPLGKGFPPPPRDMDNILLVAGGMGIATLSFFAQSLSRKKASRKIITYVGAKTAQDLPPIKPLESKHLSVKISTDDGSLGFAGTVVDLLQADLPSLLPHKTIIYGCGPSAMLRELVKIIDPKTKCYLSLEERMACGIGACLGCAVAIKGKGGSLSYARVCKDGPVFRSTEILW